MDGGIIAPALQDLTIILDRASIVAEDRKSEATTIEVGLRVVRVGADGRVQLTCGSRDGRVRKRRGSSLNDLGGFPGRHHLNASRARPAGAQRADRPARSLG